MRFDASQRPEVAELPVTEVLADIRSALRGAGSAVVVAPPGAGKTTVVPLDLLDEPWLEDRKIVVLEPRRLAARAAARRMSTLLGEEDAGGMVGYRVRMDTRVGPRTRIEVVTEGVLTRMLQADPSLDDVGAVVFDEFHERSLPADLGLALTLHARRLLREDLRVLVMSATLDAGPVANLLGRPGGRRAGAKNPSRRRPDRSRPTFHPASRPTSHPETCVPTRLRSCPARGGRTRWRPASGPVL